MEKLIDLEPQVLITTPTSLNRTPEIEETLDKVTENINLVESLNRMEGVTAALASPRGLEEKGDDIIYDGQKVTVIFHSTDQGHVIDRLIG